MGMGYTLKQALKAAELSGWNLQAAVEWLLENPDYNFESEEEEEEEEPDVDKVLEKSEKSEKVEKSEKSEELDDAMVIDEEVDEVPPEDVYKEKKSAQYFL